MHDATVDRTTNGKGPVRNLTFTELRALDAGSWKGKQFKGTMIPTFREVLKAVPPQIQLNCHLRAAPGLAAKVTEQIVEAGRLNQCFLACSVQQAAEAKAVCSKIRICNMSRQHGPNSDYPDRTIKMGAEFIQLAGWHDSMPAVVAKLHSHDVTVNYFGTSEAPMMRQLIDSGVNYILTDNLDLMLKVLAEYGVQPVRVGTESMPRSSERASPE
jgi:glycerophosphoryl diester phosphodiesterase